MKAIRTILLLFALPIVVAHACYALGCASAAKVIDDVNDPADDVALRKCRNEGRAAKDAGAGASAAFEAYRACTRDAGVRP